MTFPAMGFAPGDPLSPCVTPEIAHGEKGHLWQVKSRLPKFPPILQVKVNLKSSPQPATFPIMTDLLTITDIARRSGVAASALRFYEQRGLIRSERAGSGHRRYPRAVLRRIAFIVFAQRIGLSLDEITAELAKLPEDRAPTGKDWSRLSSTWTSRIDERIAELQRLKAGLTQCIGCGCLSLQKCQLSNPGDRAGRLGPGPRYWIGR
jgi:MerR family transcriptional regulator, redox-sensitive transcriptional activator SoxR